MKGFIFSIFAFFTVSAFAQTTLTGYVTLQNSGGKSAFPAAVKSYGATDAVVNTEKGHFKLIFDRKRPGQDVQLEVERDGYEVVNKKNLAHRLPEAHEVQRPLKLYLCPIGQWQRYAAEYEGINLKAIENSYEEKLSELQRQLENKTIEAGDYRRAAFELAKGKKIAEAQAQELAEKFAKANLDEATDRFVLAHRLFTEGKIDSVLLVLDEEKMKADLAAADKDIRDGKELIAIGEGKVLNGTEAREKIVEEFIVKARAHIIKLEWINAEHAFDVAVHADSSHAENWFEYAFFLQKQNQYNAAHSIYQHCLSIQKTEPDVARILDNLVNLYRAKNDFSQAERSFLRALEIRERLAKETPRVYEHHVAKTLTNGGLMYTVKNDFLKAKESFLRALAIYERLGKGNSRIYESDVAKTINNLGSLYLDKNNFPEAETSFLRALEIFHRLAKENPRTYEPGLAKNLDNLGILYLNKKVFSQAEKRFLQALEIRERLTKENPRAYEPDLANTLNNLAGLYFDMHDSPQAEKSFLRALEIRKRLAKENPRAYELDVAGTLYNLGILYKAKYDFPKAEKSFLPSLEIFQRLAKENPGTYEPDVAMTLNNLGHLYKVKNDFPQAEKSFLRALETQERLAEENPEIYEPFVATILNNLASFYSDKNDLPMAEKSFLRALKIRKRLAKETPGIHEPDLANILNNLGLLYRAKSDFSKAEKSFQRALEIRKRLANEKPQAMNIELCKTYYSLSLYCLTRLRSSKGEDQWREQGLEWLKKVEETLTIYPEDFKPRIQFTRLIGKLGNEFQNYNPTLAAYQEQISEQETKIKSIEKEGDKVEAQQALVNIYKEAYEEQPESEFLAQKLSFEYGRLSWYTLMAGDFPLAEASAQKALQTYSSSDWIHSNLAPALLYQGKYEAAKDIYSKKKGKLYDEKQTWTEVFLIDLEALEEEGFTHPDVAKIRVFLKE